MSYTDYEDVLKNMGNTAQESAEHLANVTGAIKDSGERRQFETGAMRDIQEGKGRCDLMPLRVIARVYDNLRDTLGHDGEVVRCIAAFQETGETTYLYHAMDLFDCFNGSWSTMFLEVAKHFEEGAKKYGENNWQKGLPVHCYIDSAVRHYLKWLRGDKDEPHDRAFVWNLMCCIWEVDFSPRKHIIGEEKPVMSFEDTAGEVSLGDCPIGLFAFESDLYVKTDRRLGERWAAVRVCDGSEYHISVDTLVRPLYAEGTEDSDE